MSGPEARRELTFDAIAVGQTYTRRRYDITPQLIDDYSRAIGAARREAVSPETGAKVQVAPPTLPAMWTPPRICFDQWQIPVGGVHTRQEWDARLPVLAGTVLFLTVVATRKWTEGARRFVVFESEFSNAAGAVAARGLMTILWPK